MKDGKNLSDGNSVKKTLTVIFSFIVAILSVLAIAGNVSHCGEQYGYFSRACSLYYVLGIAIVFLIIGLVLLLLRIQERALRFYSLSAATYFAAMFIELFDEGWRGDFWGLLLFFGLSVWVMRILMQRSGILLVAPVKAFATNSVALFAKNKISLNRVAPIEGVYEKIKSELGARYTLSMKGARVEVRQDAFRGCLLRIETQDEATDILSGPFIPSTRLALVSSFLSVGASMIVMLKINVLVGVILAVLLLFGRLLFSSRVVLEAREALKGF